MKRASIYLGALVLVLWSALWWGGSHVLARGLTSWFEARRAEGWAVDYGLGTQGYPLAFDARLRDLRLADPASGLAWDAPGLSLRAPLWAPTDLRVTFPQTQTWATPYEKIAVAAQSMTAGLGLGVSARLPVATSAVAVEALALESTAGWSARLARLTWDSQADASGLSHSLSAQAQDVQLARAAQRWIDPGQILPDTISALTLKGQFTFDTPWDLDALERRRPQPTRLVLQDVSGLWGRLELRVAGTLDVDAQGVPTGTLKVRAVNWREMVQLAQDNGSLPADAVPFAIRALETLARASGRPDTVDAELTLARGLIRIGPFPIGPAPRLRLR